MDSNKLADHDSRNSGLRPSPLAAAAEPSELHQTTVPHRYWTLLAWAADLERNVKEGTESEITALRTRAESAESQLRAIAAILDKVASRPTVDAQEKAGRVTAEAEARAAALGVEAARRAAQLIAGAEEEAAAIRDQALSADRDFLTALRSRLDEMASAQRAAIEVVTRNTAACTTLGQSQSDHAVLRPWVPPTPVPPTFDANDNYFAELRAALEDDTPLSELSLRQVPAARQR